MRILSFLDREHTVAPPGYSRWLIPPAALAVHLSIGQAYAFSVFKKPLEFDLGVSGTATGWIFSLAIVMLGLSAAFGGTWVERHGPRKAMFVSALCFSSGFLISALGAFTQQLWLIYLGYGFLGGIGLGIGYISPVSTLIKWFPDRPGLATGLAIMGFGGGALIASPWSTEMLQAFGVVADSGGTVTAVAGGAIGKAFLVHGVVYLCFMMFGVFMVRVPAEGWKPAGFDPMKVKRSTLQTTASVSAANAVRTPQFWCLWLVLFCNVTAGIGILEKAGPMIQDFFRESSTPVSASAAAGYVALLSAANMAGRFVWSSTSDKIGRKPTYVMFLGVGATLYALVTVVGATSLPLFVMFTAIILSFYGGGFATIPAYLKDLFGNYQVGAIHGRLLTAWSAAGVAGPLLVNAIADSQERGGKTGADLYTLSLTVMVGVLIVGFLANLAVRPVSEAFHMSERPSRAHADGRLEPALSQERA